MTASPSPSVAVGVGDQAYASEVASLQQEYQRLGERHHQLSSADSPDMVAIDRLHQEMDMIQSRLRAYTLRPDEKGFRERPGGI